jgi:hypothetical protein
VELNRMQIRSREGGVENVIVTDWKLPVAEVLCAGKMGTGSHFRTGIGRCMSKLRLRKWCQSPFFDRSEE